MEPVSDVKRPYFIGIAGGSCSGKTTIARGVVRRLTPPGAALVSIDSYYRGLESAAPEDIDRYNFDDPAALDSTLLLSHLRQLAAGRAADIPVYDFKTHKRTDRTERVEALAYIVVEGLFPLHWDEVRSLLRTRVFVDVPHSVCLERRLRRDVVERGRENRLGNVGQPDPVAAFGRDPRGSDSPGHLRKGQPERLPRAGAGHGRSR